VRRQEKAHALSSRAFKMYYAGKYYIHAVSGGASSLKMATKFPKNIGLGQLLSPLFYKFGWVY
jgi:hypothetical protein